MKLRLFDLDSYLKVPLRHRFADEWSRPGLTNELGSVQADGDPTGIRHTIFPPVSGSDEATCYLTINGDFLPSTGAETDVRWCPSRVVRECRWRQWKVHAVLAMVPGEHALAQRVVISSLARKSQALELGIRLSGRCVNRGMKPWSWGVPLVSTGVGHLFWNHGLDPVVTPIGREGLLFQERRNPIPGDGIIEGCERKDMRYRGQAFNAQCLRPAPDGWLSNGDAFYRRRLKPGGRLVLDFVLALDTTRRAARIAQRNVRHVSAILAEEKTRWKSLWRDVFQGKSAAFSGSLPDLEAPADVLPVAASAVLNLLYCRRRHRVTGGRTFYNILTPRRCEVCFYTWDWGLACGALARLDPAVVKRQIEIVWRNDFRKRMQFNFVTGKGFGWPYSADIFSIFYVMWNYWRARGGRARGLEEQISTRRGRRTLWQCLEELALDWRSHRHPRFGLADYGPKGHLLECVTTYAHMVAALNAAACWMLERLADLCELRGERRQADRLRSEAGELLEAILKRLYVTGTGYFCCLQPDGREIECRHAYDLGMTLWCVGEKLPEKIRDEMVAYFQRDLQTPTWVRALSPHDRDAGVSGLRADHQFSGSYCSWAGLIVLGLLKIGRWDVAEPWLKGLAQTAWQGPFGQAHWDERVMPPTAGGATKVSDQLPQGCHWCDIGGAIYFDVMEQYLIARKFREKLRG